MNLAAHPRPVFHETGPVLAQYNQFRQKYNCQKRVIPYWLLSIFQKKIPRKTIETKHIQSEDRNKSDWILYFEKFTTTSLESGVDKRITCKSVK